MRNLKRALSLALASVMVLGLMVVGSGASYADVTSEENQEAIEVLQAVGVMVGDDEGNFNPDKNVTRAQMATVMANLLDLKVEDFNAADIPFTDVPSWAVPYVAACYADGITAGVSDTLYGSDSTVTAAQAALMMMKALGYFQYQGDFEQDWTLATIKKGSEIGIFDGITVDRTSPLTRNDVAQMALNALKSNMVTFTGEVGIEIPTANGNVVVGYNPEYTARTSANSKYNQISAGTTDIASNNQYFVQLGEELYNGDLQLSNSTDDFGRPARHWEYDGEDIGDYAKTELLRASYTVEVEGGDIYGDIGASACKYNLSYWVNGVSMNKSDTSDEGDKLERKNEDKMGSTGNGVLTEVYVDTQAEETTIVEIHTYLAQANADYNEKTEKLSLTIYIGVNTPKMDTSTKTPTEITISRTVSSDDFAVENYEKDDVVLVTYAGEDKEIKSISDPNVISGVALSSYSTYGKDAEEKAYMMKAVTADGTKYDAALDSAWDAEYLYNYDLKQLKDHSWNVYLDQYGYVLGLENVEASTNYAFLIGYQPGSDVLAQAVDKALVITIDGEGSALMETVEARDDKMNSGEADQLFGHGSNHKSGNINKWVTYEMDGDVMVLKTCVDEQFRDDFTISNEKIDREYATLQGANMETPSVNTIVYGNSSSMYISVDADYSVVAESGTNGGSIVAINGITTGIKNTSVEVYDKTVAAEEATSSQPGWTNDTHGAYVLYKDGYVKYAVVVGEDGSIADRLVYLTDGISEKRYDSALDSYLYIYEGITQNELNDEIISEVAEDTNGDPLKEGVLYVASYDADGIITKMVAKTNNWMTANTINNKAAKYVQATGGQNSLADPFELNLKGATLYITAASNEHYVILDDECVFYVDSMNEKNTKETGYERYDDAENAMAALGKSSLVTGSFVAICDGDTGYATTIIINDNWYEGYETPDPTPVYTNDGLAEEATLNLATNQINVVDRVGDGSDPVELAKDVLTKNGYAIKSIVSDTRFYVTAPNGMAETWDIASIVKLYPVELSPKAGESWTVASPKTVWLAVAPGAGDTVTVTVESTQTTGFGSPSYTIAGKTETNGTVTIGTVTRDAINTKLATFNITLNSITDTSKAVEVEIDI